MLTVTIRLIFFLHVPTHAWVATYLMSVSGYQRDTRSSDGLLFLVLSRLRMFILLQIVGLNRLPIAFIKLVTLSVTNRVGAEDDWLRGPQCGHERVQTEREGREATIR